MPMTFVGAIWMCGGRGEWRATLVKAKGVRERLNLGRTSVGNAEGGDRLGYCCDQSGEG